MIINEIFSEDIGAYEERQYGASKYNLVNDARANFRAMNMLVNCSSV